MTIPTTVCFFFCLFVCLAYIMQPDSCVNLRYKTDYVDVCPGDFRPTKHLFATYPCFKESKQWLFSEVGYAYEETKILYANYTQRSHNYSEEYFTNPVVEAQWKTYRSVIMVPWIIFYFALTLYIMELPFTTSVHYKFDSIGHGCGCILIPILIVCALSMWIVGIFLLPIGLTTRYCST